jgi:hypothetical protein
MSAGEGRLRELAALVPLAGNTAWIILISLTRDLPPALTFPGKRVGAASLTAPCAAGSRYSSQNRPFFCGIAQLCTVFLPDNR